MIVRIPMTFDPVLGWCLPDNWLDYYLPPRTPLWFWAL